MVDFVKLLQQHREKKDMGIAGRIAEVNLNSDLKTGTYQIHICESRDTTYKGAEGKEGNKSSFAVIILKTKPGSLDVIGKVREINFFTSVDIGQARLLSFYAALSSEAMGKKPMTPEEFQEWDGADAFALKLELRQAAKMDVKQMKAFAALQEKIKEANIVCDVRVEKDAKGFLRYDAAPFGALCLDADTDANTEATSGSAAAPPGK